MDCQEARKLIHPYLDGELDLVKSLEVEHHLRGCTDCTRAYNSLKVLRSDFRDNALYYKTPASARRHIQAAVLKASRDEAASDIRPVFRHIKPWQWLGALAAIAVIVILAVGLIRGGLYLASSDDVLAQEVVSSHVRSQMTDHLADVASTDQHTVKPWFNGKLDFTPPVVDLAVQGYPLYGGRLDYLDDRPVAALVYRRDQHVINLFVWPKGEGAVAPPVTELRQGFHIAHWTMGGMNYWAISDVNASEFQQFIQLVQAQAS